MTAGVERVSEMIDSFGYDVMSLDDVIRGLTEIKQQFPTLSLSPVWVANCPPLYWPVQNIVVEVVNGKPEIKLFVERGGN